MLQSLLRVVISRFTLPRSIGVGQKYGLLLLNFARSRRATMKQPRAANALRGRRTVRNPRRREIAGLSRVLLAPRIRASGSCSSRQPASPGCFRPGRPLCGGGTNLLCRGLRHLLLSIGKQNSQRRFNHEETSKQSQSTSNAGPGQPRSRLGGSSQDRMDAGLQMFRRCREIYTPVSRILG